MPTQKNVELPDIGDFDSVDVIEVLVKVGDVINENDSIITLETDKATMEIPAPFAGKVTTLSIKVGDKIAKGELILTLESESEEIKGELDQVEGISENVEKTIKQEDIEVKPDNSETPQDSIKNNDEPQEELSVKTEIDSHASPSIRKLARELGVSLSKIKGTGQKGRILDKDLKSFVKQIVSHGSTDDEVEIVPLSRIKKISGKHLAKCWSTIPHVTQFDEVNIEETLN